MYFFSCDTFNRNGAGEMTVNAHGSRTRRGSLPAAAWYRTDQLRMLTILVSYSGSTSDVHN
jgi:hypothetical protein